MHYPAQAKTLIIYPAYVLNYSIQSVTSTVEFPPRRSRHLIIKKYPREFYSPIADHPAVYFIKQKKRLKKRPGLTAVTTNTARALKGFFLRFKPAFWWTSINSYHGFSRVGLEKILFAVSRALGRACRRLSRFCNILLHDPTQFHVKITRSTKLLSFCRRKLKLSTFLHTVSCNHISFLNTRSQLV